MSYFGQTSGQQLTPEQLQQMQKQQALQQMQAQQLAAQVATTQALTQGQTEFLQSLGPKGVATGVPYQAKTDWAVPVVVLVSLLGMAALAGGFFYLVNKSKAS